MDFLLDSIFHVDRLAIFSISFICLRLQLNPWPILPFTVAFYMNSM